MKMNGQLDQCVIQRNSLSYVIVCPFSLVVFLACSDFRDDHYIMQYDFDCRVDTTANFAVYKYFVFSPVSESMLCAEEQLPYARDSGRFICLLKPGERNCKFPVESTIEMKCLHCKEVQ